ncbi:MAG: hypothetical protein AB7I59_01710 [Geminicoccaceae bacterium]
MADYMVQGVVHESIPVDKLSAVDLTVAHAMGLFSAEHEGEVTFTIEGGWQDEVHAEDVMVDDQDSQELLELLGDDEFIGIEEFLRHLCRKSELPYLTVELAFTCSKMRDDGFGGAAVVVTPEAVYSQATSEWLDAKLKQLALAADAGFPALSAKSQAMAPATESAAIAYVDQLRDAALDGEVDEIDLLATLAADLLIACRAAHRTAPKSCADAVDIITQALARHELLPAGEEIEADSWLLIDVDGSDRLEIQRNDDRHGDDLTFSDDDAVRLARTESRQGCVPAIRALASHRRHKTAVRDLRRSTS